MAAIQDVARQFFEACEAGKGWAACQAYCKPDASFSAQAEPLLDVKTLQGYADWMQGLMKMMPDGHYDLKCWATDAERNNVICLCDLHRHAHWPGRAAAHRQEHAFGL